jgi:glycosyltransferase involved in cell wall biosynthesis
MLQVVSHDQIMKILISAYSCETGRGSEGEIGWRLTNALAEHHDVRVITRANLRAIHEASFVETPKPERLKFEYFDLPLIFRFYKNGKRGFLIYYYFWQIGVGLRARAMLRKEPADLLHHLIGGMDWMPAGLALCSGTFIWGPVGSENTHPILMRHQPQLSRIKAILRDTVRWAMRTLDPFTRFTGARATVVLSHTPKTMPKRYTNRLKSFTQTGITDLPILALPKTDFTRKSNLKIIYAGELKDWKGAQMALEASLMYFEIDSSAELFVFGEGPLRGKMEDIVGSHPKGNQVHFRGKVPMLQLIEELHSADMFLYPSFHHGLATIVLQAMLTGLPVVCIEGDATGRAVTTEAGITVPLYPDQAPSEGLSLAIKKLATDENLRQVLGATARKIALERYSYKVLTSSILDIYLECIKKNT